MATASKRYNESTLDINNQMNKLEIIKDLGNYSVYIKMIIEAKKCKCCGKIMLKNFGYNSPFPKFVVCNQEAQMKELGMVYESKIEVEDHTICTECVQNDKAYFNCYLCNAKLSTKLIQVSIGACSPDSICQICYAETSAKKWEETITQMQIEHKYDNY